VISPLAYLNFAISSASIDWIFPEFALDKDWFFIRKYTPIAIRTRKIKVDELKYGIIPNWVKPDGPLYPYPFIKEPM